MKKFLTITGIIVAALILGIILLGGKSQVEKVEKAIEDGDSFVLVISSLDCQVCKNYKDFTLTYYEEDPILPLYVLEIEDAFKNDVNRLYDFLIRYELIVTQEDGYSTPTTYIFKDGDFQIIGENDKKGKEGPIPLGELKDLINNA